MLIMVRPTINRKVGQKPGAIYFKPQGIPMAQLKEVVLPADGLEAIRLADAEGLYHDEAARQMGISRPTFGRILESARRAVAEAITMGRALRIGDGPVELQTGRHGGQRGRCRRGWRT